MHRRWSIVLPLLLGTALACAGCASAPSPAATATVTVTAAAPRPTAREGDVAPFDLQAVCVTESAIETALTLRDQDADRIGAGRSRGVLDAVGAQYLWLASVERPASVQEDTGVLADAAGPLAHPAFDPGSAVVERAQAHLRASCAAGGTPVGWLAQGG